MKPLACLLTAALSVMIPAAHAYDFSVGGIYYNYTSDRRAVSVTYKSLTDPSYKGDIKVPAEVTYQMVTLPVKHVEDFAFFNCQEISSVQLPESIVTIGQQAFSHCYAMTSINIPSKVTRIGDYAFEFCEDMTSITLPRSISSLGYAVFQECRGMEKYVIEDGNPYYMSEDGSIYLANGSILVQYPAAKAGSEFVIPESVTTITDYAFAPNLNLRKITINAATSDLQFGTFCECESLEEFAIEGENTGGLNVTAGVLFDQNGALIQYPLARSVAEYALPEGTTAIGELAMAGCKIDELTIPEMVNEVMDYALTGADINSIIVKCKTPPAATADSFDAGIYSYATLYVEADLIDTYRKAKGWSGFNNIHAIGESSVESIDADTDIQICGRTINADSEISVYDFEGRSVVSGARKVTLPSAGLYIVNLGDTAVRIAVK